MSSTYPPYGGTPTQPCQRCGTWLPISEPRCRNCGYDNAPAQGSGVLQSQETPWNNRSVPDVPNQGQYSSNQQWRQYQPSSQGQYNGQQWGQPPQQNNMYSQPPSTPFPFGASAQQQYTNGFQSTPSQSFQSVNNGNSPTSFSQPTSTGNYYGGVAQQPFYQLSSSAMQPNGFPPGIINTPRPFHDQPVAKVQRGPKIGLIIGIVILLMLLVGGGIVGYDFLKSSRQSVSTGPKATPIVPTPTPKGKALFADSLTNNSNRWNLLSNPGKFSAAIANGSLVLEDDNNSLLPEMVPGGRIYSNFNVYVDANLSKGEQGNGYGIYIRSALGQNNDFTTYYRFELYGDGSFAVFKGSVDNTGKVSSTRVVDYTQSQAIQKQGAVNHIEIAAKGSVMIFIVNGQILKTISDSSYASGSVALFVSNLSNAKPVAQATFSHLAIYGPQS